MLSGWGVKAAMVRVWVAGKTVIPCYTRAVSERFSDEGLLSEALYKLICLLLLLHKRDTDTY